MHDRFEMRHDGDGAHERAVITVRTSTTEGDEDTPFRVISLVDGRKDAGTEIYSQYKWIVDLLHLGILDSWIAAYSSA